VKAIQTLKLRIKDKHSKVLCAMAREVNQVFNFCNETSLKAIQGRNKWLSGYDLQKLTAGHSKCEGVTIGSGAVQVVCAEYTTGRKQFKKARLNWRVSNRKWPKYSLGWVPFKGGHAKYKAGQVEFAGSKFSLWDNYGQSKYELRAGSISQDARGRWYLNGAVEAEVKPGAGNAAIFVGNVSSKALIKTNMAKSALDAGWSMFKTMLEYKSRQAGIFFEEVNESYTTQTCSCCGVIPASSPKARAGLGIRQWTCGACGSAHDRDTNAAKNILARGHSRLVVGIPSL